MAVGHNGESSYITIEELIQRIDAQCGGMGDQNPNKVLLRQCKVTIIYLADKIPAEAVVTRGSIVAP